MFCPIRFVPYGESLRAHVDELRTIRVRRLRSKPESVPNTGALEEGFEGLTALVRAVQGFQSRAAELDRSLDELTSGEGQTSATLAKVNDLLSQVERAFLLSEGLPGRPWFKHAIYAPGVTTGYGAWPFPAIREAIEENKPGSLEAPVKQSVAAIERGTAALGKVLEAAGSQSVARRPGQ